MMIVDLHREQIRRLWPEINARVMVPIGDGWTCDTYEVDRRWIVQFPRTRHAEESLRKQKMLLPQLGARLSAAIPRPVPASDRDASPMLYRKIEGEAFPNMPLGAWPEQLGVFLHKLQAIEPRDLGLADRSVEELREAKHAELEKLSARVLSLLGTEECSELQRIFREYLGDDQAWSFRSAIVHNDLGPPHILVDHSGNLAGVIDWEDLSVGDPVSDFVWMLGECPEIARRMADAFGGETDEGFRVRAKTLYLLMPFYEVTYGQESGQPEIIKSGLNGIVSRLRRSHELGKLSGNGIVAKGRDG